MVELWDNGARRGGGGICNWLFENFSTKRPALSRPYVADSICISGILVLTVSTQKSMFVSSPAVVKTPSSPVSSLRLQLN